MNDFWRKLLYRWFVEYNPLYLVSAMLVLGGTILTSRGLATEGSLYGPLGVAGIAEVYALALIGGAALLTRIGQRRPAVMLALLTALYQCDLTLHTETCVQLGLAGTCAAAVWLALFALKLFALGWAMKVRVSLGAFGTAMLGASTLVIGPYVIEHARYEQAGAFLAVLNAPPTGDEPAKWTENESRRCLEATLSTLSRSGLSIEASHVVTTTPADFAARFPGSGGSLYGSAPHGPMSALSRPGSRSPLAGLYLAGGSVHPGPGVPMATLSGRFAAENDRRSRGAQGAQATFSQPPPSPCRQ